MQMPMPDGSRQACSFAPGALGRASLPPQGFAATGFKATTDMRLRSAFSSQLPGGICSGIQ